MGNWRWCLVYRGIIKWMEKVCIHSLVDKYLNIFSVYGNPWYLRKICNIWFRHPNMITPRAGFSLVSLKTGQASDQTNMLAIGGIRLSIESVSSFVIFILTYSIWISNRVWCQHTIICIVETIWDVGHCRSIWWKLLVQSRPWQGIFIDSKDC